MRRLKSSGRLAALALGACLATLPGAAALAHGMSTAVLELVELHEGTASMAWRAPSAASGARPATPEGCRLRAAPEDLATTTRAAWVLECPGGLAGRTLAVDGLGPVVTDVIVRVALADGTARSTVLRAEPGERSATWLIPAEGDTQATLLRYGRLGLEHIAGGADHLLFLLGLVLALGTLRGVLVAETAFTASHSMSFALTALGWVRLPSAATEAAIALSLVLVARELVRARGPAATRPTAALAFTFGAVHGLGFAGGLRELGLPETDVAHALVGFAGGVEVGQLVFVLAAWGVSWWARRSLPTLRVAGGVVIGVVAMAWLIERVAPIVG